MDKDWFAYANECASLINSLGFPENCNTALILGTGLGNVKSALETIFSVAYEELPHFPESTVEGHAGRLIVGKIGDQYLCCLDGRFHYYEGYSMKELTFPIRVLKLLGIKNLIITNVAGGLNPYYDAGDIIIVSDHINLHPEHPLRGENDKRFGLRFPDMKSAYSPFLIDKAEVAFAKAQLPIKKGVYVGLQGPSLETPAEYKFLRIIGGDLVGMSTVPEVIVANHAGINVLVLSMVSNVCFPINKITETTVEDVIAIAEAASPKLQSVVLQVIQSL